MNTVKGLTLCTTRSIIPFYVKKKQQASLQRRTLLALDICCLERQKTVEQRYGKGMRQRNSIT